MENIKMSVIKDEEKELPIPQVWRDVFCQIVKALSNKDYLVNSTISNVPSLSIDDSKYIEDNIESYGEELTELPAETWDSSIYLWMGTHWDVIIDLWTLGEGRSDLVLSAKVYETNNEYTFKIEMVYVP
jgi:hypothetical protein